MVPGILMKANSLLCILHLELKTTWLEEINSIMSFNLQGSIFPCKGKGRLLS